MKINPNKKIPKNILDYLEKNDMIQKPVKKRLSKEESMELANSDCFYPLTNGWGVPGYIKEPVLYLRLEYSKVRGGHYSLDNPVYRTEEGEGLNVDYTGRLLKAILIIHSDPSIKQLMDIKNLVKDSFERENEYYGNSTTYRVFWIELERVYQILEV